MPLRPKVFDTLCVLAARAGSLVTKDELLKAVWPDAIVEENNVALTITALRKALGEADPGGKWIETISRKGYRFKGEVRVPMSAALAPAAPPLWQREAELEALRGCFQAALEAQRQFVCITGEAGIGKTALLQAFRRELDASRGPLLVGSGQCVEHVGPGEPYMPVLEALSHMGRSAHAGEVAAVLDRYAPSWLLGLPGLVEPHRMDALRERVLGITRERMLREFGDAIETLAAQLPVVLLLEDLHWADPSTLQLLRTTARRQPAARLLIAGTNRGRDGGETGSAFAALSEEL